MKRFNLFFIFIILIFLFSSCTENASLKKDITYDDFEINILHAGGGYDGLILLNAQETFDYYYEQGYRYFEYDFKLSTDGRLIGTHSFEHLSISQTVSYDEFKALKLSNGFTPVNEEWLVQTVKEHPDVRFIIDAKMDSALLDAAVLQRIEELEEIHDVDMSPNIIPEIFSVEMWETVQNSTSFDAYIFSHYKEYYSVDKILECFSSPKIIAVAVPTWTDGYIESNLYKVKESNKKIFVFTVTNYNEITFANGVNADAIYIDTPIN